MKKGFPIRVPNPKISAKQNPPTWCLALLSLFVVLVSVVFVGGFVLACTVVRWGSLCRVGVGLGLGVVVCAYCRSEGVVGVRILSGHVVAGVRT